MTSYMTHAQVYKKFVTVQYHFFDFDTILTKYCDIDTIFSE